MKNISVIDEVQLKAEFKRLYKELGYNEMMQVLYELITSVRICGEAIKEELENERN